MSWTAVLEPPSRPRGQYIPAQASLGQCRTPQASPHQSRPAYPRKSHSMPDIASPGKLNTTLASPPTPRHPRSFQTITGFTRPPQNSAGQIRQSQVTPGQPTPTTHGSPPCPAHLRSSQQPRQSQDILASWGHSVPTQVSSYQPFQADSSPFQSIPAQDIPGQRRPEQANTCQSTPAEANPDQSRTANDSAGQPRIALANLEKNHGIPCKLMQPRPILGSNSAPTTHPP
jgi:hypothetical protein